MDLLSAFIKSKLGQNDFLMTELTHILSRFNITL
jgi:hypothetical protein